MHHKATKRILMEIYQIQQSEFRKKFLSDFCSFFHTDKPPAPFNKKRPPQYLYNTETPLILGRILPEKKPYCLASFLIQIRFSVEYPFQPPEVIFLDQIHHPHVVKDGSFCYWCTSCNFPEEWRPTKRLVDIITTIINRIDNPDLSFHCNTELADEYQNNYATFYKTALQHTFKYGRPRH